MLPSKVYPHYVPSRYLLGKLGTFENVAPDQAKLLKLLLVVINRHGSLASFLRRAGIV